MNKAVLLTLLAVAFAGCTDDTTTPEEPVLREPVAAEPGFASVQPAVTTGLEHVARLALGDGHFPSGSGIWAHGDYVYGSALGAGFFIADISDPEAPVLVYNATTNLDDDNNTVTSFARDADVIAHPDGRMTLILATQTNGMHIWDVTDPTAPVPASIISDIGPNHNVAVIPGTELVFNSQSGGLGRTNEVIDASDAYNAQVINAFGTHGCHDITFFGSLGDEKFRAYCAGIDRTEIWDMTGFNTTTGDGITVIATIGCSGEAPTTPEGIIASPSCTAESPVVGNPVFGSFPVRTLHHLAMVNEGGNLLIIGDEQNGGGTPGACYANEDNTGASTPFGALWFYDISDETAPALLSWISAPTIVPSDPGTPDPTTVDPTDPNSIINLARPATSAAPNCTAHFGSLVPGEEKLVMAWYSAGVLLIDFSDPSTPRILDQMQPDPTNPWDARIHGGYVFTGDIVRGMDVLKLV